MIDKKRLIFLDYLRIFAVLSVVISHKFPTLFPFYDSGGCGVIIFFIISGYIITHVLLKEATKVFLIKRIFRIYPLYITAVLLEVLLTDSPVKLRNILIQLSLMGDFFHAPYALNGIEWTLRIEMVFYIFMALLKSAGVIEDRKFALPVVLFLSTILIGLLSPFSPVPGFGYSYFSFYAPFLFVGVYFLLLEKKEIKLKWFCFLVLTVFVQYFYLAHKYIGQKYDLIGISHFTILGSLIFAILFLIRNYLKPNNLILSFSSLTYSIYLLHHWAWDLLRKQVSQILSFGNVNLNPLTLDSLVFLLLIFYCFILHKLIEKNGIKIGSNFINKHFSKAK